MVERKSLDNLSYDKKLEVLLYIRQDKVPLAVSVVHHELQCGLKEAKEIVDRNR